MKADEAEILGELVSAAQGSRGSDADIESGCPSKSRPVTPPASVRPAKHGAVGTISEGRDSAGSGSTGPRVIRERRPHHWMSTYRRNVMCTDVVIVAGMVFASQTIRFPGRATMAVTGAHGFNYWMLSMGLVLTWVLSLGINGVWDQKVLGSGPSEYRRIMQASFYVFGFIAILSYLARADIARGYLAMALPLGLTGVLAGRWVWRQLLHEHRRSGSHMNSVLVIGGRSSAVALASRLRSAPDFGYRVSGLCLPPAAVASGSATGELDGFPVVGSLDEVVAAIDRVRADTVAVSASEYFGSEQVRQLAWQLEGSGVGLFLAPALTDVAGPRIHIKPVAGLPLMHVQEPMFKGPKLVIKTALDLIGAALALVLLSPVVLLVATAIKLDDRGPVFFRQERVGLGGRSFRVWKFRSMKHGADLQFATIRESAGQASGVFYKSADDPRVTRVGRFIRKTSIDELPQLFDVISGRMSLVGPRPLVPGEGAEIGNFIERRMLVRPGITGLWQVSGRSTLSAEERIRLDFYYVENWSVAGDLVIIAKTVRAVLGKTGAY